MDIDNDHVCPLCANRSNTRYWRDRGRHYWQCSRCRLVFVPPYYHLSFRAEKAEYDLHQNDPGDVRYRLFLARLFDPLQDRLKPCSRGLDFGCGPGPALSLMFEAAGHQMSIYDSYYAPEPRLLDRRYDFITITEVVEHLRHPGEELDRLWKMLPTKGHLGIMTKQVTGREAFGKWHYIQDPTHICFFSRHTFTWLAGRWQADVEFIGADVIIFQK